MDAGTNPDDGCHVRTRARFSMVFAVRIVVGQSGCAA